MGILDGRAILITGAARGLGLAMARAMAVQGAMIALVDLDYEEVGDAAREIAAIAGNASVIPIAADVSDPDSARDAVDYGAAGFGHLDAVFNNAAVGPQTVAGDFYGDPPRFWELDAGNFGRMMMTNAAGPQYVAAAAVPHLRLRGAGRIVNVTTALDAMYAPGMGAYGPSKAALEAHTAIMSKDLEKTRITANVLIPGGPANTRMIPEATGIPLQALIQPEAMQAPAIWLASAESDGFSGKRVVAALWDESLALAERLERATAPCAWPQLGRQAILPETISR